MIRAMRVALGHAVAATQVPLPVSDGVRGGLADRLGPAGEVVAGALVDLLERADAVERDLRRDRQSPRAPVTAVQRRIVS